MVNLKREFVFLPTFLPFPRTFHDPKGVQDYKDEGNKQNPREFFDSLLTHHIALIFYIKKKT